MKKTLAIIFLAATLVGCRKESVHYTIPSTQATLTTELSSVQVALDEDHPSDVALTLTAGNKEGLDLRYQFKMDLAKNNFLNPTELRIMPEGIIALTNNELNEFLIERGLNGEDAFTEVAIRFIGSEFKSDKYHKPVIKDTLISLKGYYESPLKFIKDVYIWGDGCEAGWDTANMIKLEKIDGADPAVRQFRYHGLLYPQSEGREGQFKFPLVEGAWDGPTLIAPRAGTLASGSSEIVYSATGQPDYKFLVKTFGMYDVTVDIRKMRVTFTMLDDFRDLLAPRIWMVGDATDGGWESNPFPYELKMDPKNRGIFTWEGNLKAGEFKFPLQERYFECDYIRPPYADAPIEDGPVVRGGTDPDNKWRVTEQAAGYYKITIDANPANPTIKFEKQ